MTDKEKESEMQDKEINAEASAIEKPVSRRVAVGLGAIGVAALAGVGALGRWGVTAEAIETGRVTFNDTPDKLLITEMYKCSGCQRCEISCSLKNFGESHPFVSAIQIYPQYFFGTSVGSGGGTYGDCQFPATTCKQCPEAFCLHACPISSIYRDKEDGTVKVNRDTCIGCGMCAEACPWGAPNIDPATSTSFKCVACGRCADQCPNDAIHLIEWEDIADELLAKMEGE